MMRLKMREWKMRFCQRCKGGKRSSIYASRMESRTDIVRTL